MGVPEWHPDLEKSSRAVDLMVYHYDDANPVESDLYRSRLFDLISETTLLERNRCADYCDSLAKMMEDGAGEVSPGARLRQAARWIRNGGTA